MANEMYHWGIKGMKWGIRRFQKKDGSLTPEGKKRYDDDPDNDREEKITVEEAKRRIVAADDPSVFYANRKLFTPEEIKANYMRFEFEKKIADLRPKQVSKGQKFVDDFVKFGANMDAVTKTGMTLWNDFARIYNATPQGRQHNLPRITN